MRFLNAIFFLIILQAIVGCGGYKIINNSNPFSKHGINRIRVPLFINRTIFPNISAAFTNSLISKLHNYSALNIEGGDPSEEGDHALIGILTSGVNESRVLEPLIRKFTGNSSSLSAAIGERPNFYLTGQYRVKLSLDLILIQNPLIGGKQQTKKPRVLGYHSIPITFDVVNNISAVSGPDSQGVTNYTNNKAFFKYEIQKAADKAAEILENMIAI